MGEETSRSLVIGGKVEGVVPSWPRTSSIRRRSVMLSPSSSFMSTNSPAAIFSTSLEGIGGKAGDNTTDCLRDDGRDDGLACGIGDASKVDSDGMRLELEPAFDAVVPPSDTAKGMEERDRGGGICPSVEPPI